jgi:hypothetical protein
MMGKDTRTSKQVKLAILAREKKRRDQVPPFLTIKTKPRQTLTAEQEIDEELSFMTEDEDYQRE